MRRVNGELRLSPTDLNGFVACRHLTDLDLRRARGELRLDKAPRPDAELVAERGRLHEQRFLDALRDEGRSVEAISADGGIEAAAERTRHAMSEGVEVIHQAAFLDGGWNGYADFLMKVEEPSELGEWSYEAYDAKLAAHPKPYFILQLVFYSEQVGRLQGRLPERMHLVLGTQEQPSFRLADFQAYTRRVRAHFTSYLAELEEGADPPYPYPVEHCAYCDWWARCRDRRRADDHLSLVAFLSRAQAIKLEAADVRTVERLALLPDDFRAPRLAHATLKGLRQQARLQVEGRTTGRPVHELLPPEPGRGFARMPEPSRGDIFFDIEGDPYWGEEGLEYLLGSLTLDGPGETAVYRELWAHSQDEERLRFEEWMDWVTARLADFPDLHIYHYNAYEPTAIKKLMSRYGTREREVDELLWRNVFVDLYAVVRQSMRVGKESYSLKALEDFYDFGRDTEVTEAGGSILAYQEYLESRDEEKLRSIAEYNADDCRSTLGLRDWLLTERAEAEREFGVDIPTLDVEPIREVTERKRDQLDELEDLRLRLTAGLPPDDLDESQRAYRLAADLLDYHQREQRPAWWAYFDRLTKTAEELRDEDPEAIGGLVPAEGIDLREDKRSFLYPLRFPAQQYKLGPGKVLDPATEKQVSLAELDEEDGLLWIKRGKQAHAAPLPEALVPGQPIPQTSQQAALRALARRICELGTDPAGELDAACDILTRRTPRIDGHHAGAPIQAGSVDLALLQDQVARLDNSALFVQGPPGSGKTWTGARLAVGLIRSGARVGIAATSHKAIHNLLDRIEEAAAETGTAFRGLKKSSSDYPDSHYESAQIESADSNDAFPPSPEYRLIAGTPWLWAREAMHGSVDFLFLDEAGQVALADALAISQAAGNVVLLGDPQQLAHVSQGTHPHESGCSVLRHLLGDADTVDPAKGVFLDHTYRMHPKIARFVSSTMYDGRLEAVPGLDRQTVASPGLQGAGLRLLPVEHLENRQSAPEEARRIAEEVGLLLDGGRVVDSEEVERPLTLEDILVVTPFNAQVRCLAQHLPGGARIGTVDKFQGQQASIVFFSMTSSTGEDVPRGMDFLFNRNRLNVAVSRAQALAAVVCSPSLLWARCNTVEQMRLVNLLCEFADEAERQGGVSSATPAP